MPVPTYETLMLPVLRMFEGGAKNVAACIPQVKDQFEMTDEEAEELLPRVSVLIKPLLSSIRGLVGRGRWPFRSAFA